MKGKNAKLMSSLTVFVLGVLSILSLVWAGNLEPNDPPGPTMSTLSDISNEVGMVQTSVDSLSAEIGGLGNNGNFCVTGPSTANAWCQETDSWYSCSVPGGANGIKESKGNFCVYNNSHAYAWSKDTKLWYHLDFSGESKRSEVAAAGNFFIGTNSNAYAWNKDTRSWTNISLACDHTIGSEY